MRGRTGLNVSWKRGFTLVEVLVIVAAVAILALLAVPNILEARARARFSQSLTEMHSIAIAVEAYNQDNSVYPTKRPQPLPPGVDPGTPFASSLRSWVPQSPDLDAVSITTPVAYVSRVPLDPFNVRSTVTSAVAGDHPVKTYRYFRILTPPLEESTSAEAGGSDVDRSFFGESANLVGHHYGRWYLQGFGPDRDADAPGLAVRYDPTNGSVSDGDVVVTQRGSFQE